MNSNIKWIFYKLLPPIIVDFILFIKSKLLGFSSKRQVFFGNYDSWEDAVKSSSGYNSDIIFENVKKSALKVRNGDAVYERDSVIFNKIEYSYPLLAGLMWVAAQNEGKLNLIDFGGALGTTYYQNKKFINELNEVNWFIVEQPKFVKIGKELFENNNLKFFNTIDACLKCCHISVILLSSVIQYFKNPNELIEKILKYNFQYIILDRTFFINAENDRIAIHVVDENIFSASIPTWFFNYEKFINKFTKNYDLICDFYSFDTSNITIGNNNAINKGIIFKLKIV